MASLLSTQCNSSTTLALPRSDFFPTPQASQSIVSERERGREEGCASRMVRGGREREREGERGGFREGKETK
eukprot:684427-Rhodomonas_salina.4